MSEKRTRPICETSCIECWEDCWSMIKFAWDYTGMQIQNWYWATTTQYHSYKYQLYRSCEMITFQSSQSSQISPPFNVNWLATIVFRSWDTWGWLQPESLRLTAPPPEELDQWVTGLNINMITASLAGSLLSSPWLCYTAPNSRSLWAFSCRDHPTLFNHLMMIKQHMTKIPSKNRRERTPEAICVPKQGFINPAMCALNLTAEVYHKVP